jgi:hypothetical protein
MNELHLCRDPREGTDYCLRVGMDRLGAQAGVVHAFDVDRREFFVANALGLPAAPTFLTSRQPESDPVLSLARQQEDAVVMQGARSPAAGLERYRAIGDVSSVVAAPLLPAGIFVGAIEFINPADAAAPAANAVSYIARQLARFIVSHGIVT